MDEMNSSERAADDLLTVYVTIGSPWNQLSQRAYSMYYNRLCRTIKKFAEEISGSWLTMSAFPVQGACVRFTIKPSRRNGLKRELGKLAREYRRYAVTWSEAEPEVIEAKGDASDLEAAAELEAECRESLKSVGLVVDKVPAGYAVAEAGSPADTWFILTALPQLAEFTDARMRAIAAG